MWIEIAAGSYLTLRYIYHRLTEEEVEVKPDREIKIPSIDEGSAIPMYFGKCRIRKPILVWCSEPHATKAGTQDSYDNGPERFQYGMEMFFVVGIGFQDGTTTFHKLWASDKRLKQLNDASVLSVDLDTINDAETEYALGLSARRCQLSTATLDSPGTNDDRTDPYDLWIDGNVEVFKGGTFQRLVEDTFPYAARTKAGERMLADGVPGNQIPGYRGYSGLFLYSPSGLPGVSGWHFGFSSSVQAYSTEVSSYPNSGGRLAGFQDINEEANPIDVIYAILVTHWGRLGLYYHDWIDLVSFQAAALTLLNEGHGYSRAFEDTSVAAEMIEEILRQIDATIYEDMETGKFKIKLIRADYNLADLPHLTTDTCKGLENFACGGWDGVPDKVRVIFDNRALDYKDDSVLAMRSAEVGNISGREIVIRYPGCKTIAQAKKLAAREMGARSRPLCKCTAYIDRSFGTINPGDAIKVTYPEYGLDQRVFRVAAIDRGTLEENTLKVELLEDFYFSYRGATLHPWDEVDDLPVFGLEAA